MTLYDIIMIYQSMFFCLFVFFMAETGFLYSANLPCTANLPVCCQTCWFDLIWFGLMSFIKL